MILRAMFHIVSSLLSDFDAKCPRTPTENEFELKTKIRSICASSIVIMLLHKGLTHVHSQIKPRLHFEFHFN